MENKINKYIIASYRLYDITDGQNEIVEQTSDDNPFVFITGLGLVLDEFEKQLTALKKGEKFEITLQPKQAYGSYNEEYVMSLDKQTFYVNGKFDEANVYPDAIIPLQNSEGAYLMGRVIKVTDEQVTIDMNHPLAGKTLRFCGEIVESHDASNEEIAAVVEKLSGHGCNCGGDCGCGEHEHEGDCHCGGHGQKGGCCGKHHEH